MTEQIKELEEDIQEIQLISLQAERPNNQNQLATLINKMKTDLEKLKSIKIKQDLPKPIPAALVPKQQDKTVYTALTKYAWDQEGNKIKIFFSLQGVGSQCGKDQVDVTFEKWSVEVKLRGYKKQNLIFAIRKLNGEIVASDCKYLLKTNTLSVVLIKKDQKSWPQLAYKDEKFAKTENEQQKKPEDPSAGIMNMMKKMYEQGDDNMKKTIAQAWTKANDKKGGKGGQDGNTPDFSDRYDSFKK